MGSGLGLHVLLHTSVFPIKLYMYFPALVYLEKKKSRNLLPPEPEPNMRLIRMIVSGGGDDSFIQLLHKQVRGWWRIVLG